MQRAHTALGRDQLSRRRLAIAKQPVTPPHLSKFQHCPAAKGKAILTGDVASFPLSQSNNRAGGSSVHSSSRATRRSRQPQRSAAQPARRSAFGAALDPALVRAPGTGSLRCPASSHRSRTPQPCHPSPQTLPELPKPPAVKPQLQSTSGLCSSYAGQQKMLCLPPPLSKHSAINHRRFAFFSAPSTPPEGDSQSLPYARVPGTNASVLPPILTERGFLGAPCAQS